MAEVKSGLRGTDYFTLGHIERARQLLEDMDERSMSQDNGVVDSMAREFVSSRLRSIGEDKFAYWASGFRIVESAAMVEPGPMVARVRPWRERLLCRPWRPFQATKMVPTVKPRKDVLRVGGMLIMHPDVALAIRVAVELDG